MKDKIAIIVAAFATPIKVGIYKNNLLVREMESCDKTSGVLPQIFDTLLKEYEITSIYFAKGPGSFMALKLQYIFFKTIQTTLNIPIKATDSFYFTQGCKVYATKKVAFIKQGADIVLKSAMEADGGINEIVLPKELVESHFSDDIAPLYLLPAI